MASPILKRFSEETGLFYDGKQPMLTGIYHGYPVTLTWLSSAQCVTISASGTAPEETQPPEVLFSGIRGRLKGIRSAMLKGNRVEVVYSLRRLGGKQMTDIQYILDCITAFLGQNGWQPSCENCSSPALGFAEVSGVARCLCEPCTAQIESALEQNRQEKVRRKGNFFTGLIGAILGALIGAVLWVVVAQIGYIAAVIGLVMGVLTIKGFELLGGRINIASIITCCVVVGIVLMLANGVSLGLEIYSVYKSEAVSVFDCIATVPDFLAYSEIASTFWGNTAIGLLLTYVALIPTAIGIYRNKAGTYSLRRISAAPPVNGPER